jgi:hypothetical protein
MVSSIEGIALSHKKERLLSFGQRFFLSALNGGVSRNEVIDDCERARQHHTDSTQTWWRCFVNLPASWVIDCPNVECQRAYKWCE